VICPVLRICRPPWSVGRIRPGVLPGQDHAETGDGGARGHAGTGCGLR
jgi:hypothetical protein